jgi:hypothetical protein
MRFYGTKLILFMLVLVGLSLTTRLVTAFAEETLNFIDPATGLETDDPISSLHFDLTRALALAAGFSEANARTLQIYDQLVDSEKLGPPENPAKYSNCAGAFKSIPNPDTAQVCPTGKGAGKVIWPIWDNVPDLTCATSRYGPYMPLFHFSESGSADLQNLADWGWGRKSTVQSGAAYAWGNTLTPLGDIIDAKCTYKQAETVEIGLSAGSLEAFATYLHVLADASSHDACINALQSLYPALPWATHTQKTLNDVVECNYNPTSPQNDDAHGREFGPNYPGDSQRTIAAAKNVYAELSNRSFVREGNYLPLPLSTVITVGSDGAITLEEALFRYARNYEFNQASARRVYVNSIVAGILAVSRTESKRLYAPIVLK